MLLLHTPREKPQPSYNFPNVNEDQGETEQTTNKCISLGEIISRRYPESAGKQRRSPHSLTTTAQVRANKTVGSYTVAPTHAPKHQRIRKQEPISKQRSWGKRMNNVNLIINATIETEQRAIVMRCMKAYAISRNCAYINDDKPPYHNTIRR